MVIKGQLGLAAPGQRRDAQNGCTCSAAIVILKCSLQHTTLLSSCTHLAGKLGYGDALAQVAQHAQLGSLQTGSETDHVRSSA